MQIIIDNIEQFRVFFDVIYDVASDLLELQLFADKITCSVLDGSHTCFFYVEYESMFFRKYDVDKIGSVTVFTDDIYKLLKLTNKTDELTLDIDDAHMTAEIISKNGTKRLFEFVMPSDYIESPKYPSLDADCVLNMDTGEIKQAVKDIGLIGTNIFQIVVSSESVVYMCDSTNYSDEFTSTKYAQTIEMETGIVDTLISRFSLKFISTILKFDKISKTVELKVGSDFPLLWKFEDEDMGVKVSGMIAPRLEMEG